MGGGGSEVTNSLICVCVWEKKGEKIECVLKGARGGESRGAVITWGAKRERRGERDVHREGGHSERGDGRKKKVEDSEELSHSSLMTFCATGSRITEIYFQKTLQNSTCASFHSWRLACL